MINRYITLRLIMPAIIFFSSVQYILAGNDDDRKISAGDLNTYKAQVKELVKYLEGTFNFLGDSKEPTAEKEIIINESYLKIFEDSKVQIEDDLDMNRDVPIYKNVQAYLKDIVFFFKDVEFSFVVSGIEAYQNDNGDIYFKVTLNRTLKGVTVDNDTVNWKLVRYVEINLNPAESSLKIASIYTNKLNEKEDIRNWWNTLPPEWRRIFGSNVIVSDSLKLSDIVYFTDSILLIETGTSNTPHDTLSKTDNGFSIEVPHGRETATNSLHKYDTTSFQEKGINIKYLYSKINGILNQTELDISGNDKIRTLKPLAKLTRLEEIDLSNTLISDITPLRNLNELSVINFSQTPVSDLTPLQYSAKITKLNCSYTLVQDMEVIANFITLRKLWISGNRITTLDFVTQLVNLTFLDCSDTKVYDLTPLKNLTHLEELIVEGTLVKELEPLKDLKSLERLNCNRTPITSLSALSNLDSLKVLHISSTTVNTLKPLDALNNLKYIYCDNTEIKKEQTLEFMRNHPGCLIIFETEELMKNWKSLEKAWKDVIVELTGIGENPTREELHRIITATELDISGNKEIKTLRPLRNLFNLQKLDISGTSATDFDYIANCIELKELNMESTAVSGLQFLSKLKKLQILNIDNTNIESLKPLEELNELKIIYADNTKITDDEAFNFHKKHPGTLIIYKTAILKKWWDGLPMQWKSLFSSQFKVDSPPSKKQLHKIIFIDSLIIENRPDITGITPLTALKGLVTLSLSGTGVRDLSPVTKLSSLQYLTCKQGPLNDITPLAYVQNLKYLNIKETSVDDIKPVSELTNLEVLIISGTNVKSLKPLTNLKNLKVIEINNTTIKSIKPLYGLTGLTSLKCFNTKISEKNIAKFKGINPGCEVVYY